MPMKFEISKPKAVVTKMHAIIGETSLHGYEILTIKSRLALGPIQRNSANNELCMNNLCIFKVNALHPKCLKRTVRTFTG